MVLHGQDSTAAAADSFARGSQRFTGACGSVARYSTETAHRRADCIQPTREESRRVSHVDWDEVGKVDAVGEEGAIEHAEV